MRLKVKPNILVFARPVGMAFIHVHAVCPAGFFLPINSCIQSCVFLLSGNRLFNFTS
jgi:hypothetical protein